MHARTVPPCVNEAVDASKKIANRQVNSLFSAVVFDFFDAVEPVLRCARSGDSEHAGRELGDLLLAAVNAARFLRTDPALRLLEATERLEKRASAALALLREQGRDPASCTPCELDAAWRAVKTQEGKQLNERP